MSTPTSGTEIDVRVLAHTGSNTLWYSMIWMPLEWGSGVVVVTNQGGDRAREAVDEVLRQLVVDHVERRRERAESAGRIE